MKHVVLIMRIISDENKHGRFQAGKAQEGLTWTQNKIRLRKFPKKKIGTHFKELQDFQHSKKLFKTHYFQKISYLSKPSERG